MGGFEENAVPGYVPMCQLHGEKLGDSFQSYQEHCNAKHDGAQITVVWVERET